MEPNAKVEARVQELCETNLQAFAEIVRQELNGNLDELTQSALMRPRVVKRWYKMLGQEHKDNTFELSKLHRRPCSTGPDPKHQKLTARKHAIMRRLSDLEWLVERLDADMLELQKIENEKRRNEKKSAAEKKRAEQEQSSLRKEAMRRLANRYPDELRTILEELLVERGKSNPPELATRIRNWML